MSSARKKLKKKGATTPICLGFILLMMYDDPQWLSPINAASKALCCRWFVLFRVEAVFKQRGNSMRAKKVEIKTHTGRSQQAPYALQVRF
jgi:hypothetical protein